MRAHLPVSLLCALAFAGAARGETVYVSNEKGNSITVIDAATLKVVATWPIGRRPRGSVLSRDGKFL